jgi:N-acetylmuramoyl-L-alanine amidase
MLCLVTLVALGASPVATVVIDAGHGGSETGARSPQGKLEKTLSLAVARKIKAALIKELGVQVVLTRDDDVQVKLSERVNLANKKKPDLFISIHANSMPTQKQRRLNEGIETYFLSAAASGDAAKKVAARENDEKASGVNAKSSDSLSFILADLQRAEAHVDSSRLAYAVHESLIEETEAKDRGVQQAPFFVLMGLEAPAILVEMGFISHPEEGKRLFDAGYEDRLAAAVVHGVSRFLKETVEREK